MTRFIFKNILKPLAGRWFSGFLMLIFWTVAFISLPAISGWFIAICSVVFITTNTLFSYLVPSAIIRLLTLLRTSTRYFERLNNHKTTLDAQRKLQLKVFSSVALFPYFKKQVNNNSSILENSTYGIDMILNHILLWILPFASLIITICFYFFFLNFNSFEIAIEFLISSAVLLFIIPQFIYIKNRKLYAEIRTLREENNKLLIESFRGRIEISKYNLEGKAIKQHEKRILRIDKIENKLQNNSFSLQMIVGLGFSCIAIFTLWNSSNYEISAQMAIGIFFGIMAQAELSEMLFSGKSEKSSVTHQINDLESILKQGEKPIISAVVDSEMESLFIKNVIAKIPETNIITDQVSLEIKRGDWIAIYGETGKGKTTFLNSLFYPEYRFSGSLIWNNNAIITHLPVPDAIYVNQKAYLLTGTLGENFQGYPHKDIIHAIETVDLSDWYLMLPKGLDSWLGENSEALSGGQRKKLLLAQALLKKPQILVVDEPTAGISSKNAIDIFKNIKLQYPHITIIMATHLKSFEKIVDKVLRI